MVVVMSELAKIQKFVLCENTGAIYSILLVVKNMRVTSPTFYIYTCVCVYTSSLKSLGPNINGNCQLLNTLPSLLHFLYVLLIQYFLHRILALTHSSQTDQIKRKFCKVFHMYNSFITFSVKLVVSTFYSYNLCQHPRVT